MSVVVPGHRVVGPLGDGAHGDVFEAVELSRSRRVALKVLRDWRDAEQDAKALATELDSLRDLAENRFVVDLLGHGWCTYEGDRLPFLAMAFAERGSVDQMARKAPERRLGPDEVTRVGQHIATALTTAHEVGILHRDVKPANILVMPVPGETEPWRYQLCDFGIARSLGSTLTVPAVFRGTPQYSSPQRLRGESHTAADDQYGLAASLYELAVGQRAHQADEPDGTSAEHFFAFAAAIEAGGPVRVPQHVPPLLGRVIERGMAYRPDDRFATCGQMLASLLGGQVVQPPGRPPIPDTVGGAIVTEPAGGATVPEHADRFARSKPWPTDWVTSGRRISAPAGDPWDASVQYGGRAHRDRRSLADAIRQDPTEIERILQGKHRRAQFAEELLRLLPSTDTTDLFDRWESSRPTLASAVPDLIILLDPDGPAVAVCDATVEGEQTQIAAPLHDLLMAMDGAGPARPDIVKCLTSVWDGRILERYAAASPQHVELGEIARRWRAGCVLAALSSTRFRSSDLVSQHPDTRAWVLGATVCPDEALGALTHRGNLDAFGTPELAEPFVSPDQCQKVIDAVRALAADGDLDFPGTDAQLVELLRLEPSAVIGHLNRGHRTPASDATAGETAPAPAEQVDQEPGPAERAAAFDTAVRVSRRRRASEARGCAYVIASLSAVFALGALALGRGAWRLGGALGSATVWPFGGRAGPWPPALARQLGDWWPDLVVVPGIGRFSLPALIGAGIAVVSAVSGCRAARRIRGRGSRSMADRVRLERQRSSMIRDETFGPAAGRLSGPAIRTIVGDSDPRSVHLPPRFWSVYSLGVLGAMLALVSVQPVLIWWIWLVPFAAALCAWALVSVSKRS